MDRISLSIFQPKDEAKQPEEHREAFVKAYPYQRSQFLLFCYIVLCLLSVGILPLFAFWYPVIFTSLARRKIEDHFSAEYELIKGFDGSYEECKVKETTFDQKKIRYIKYRNVRLIMRDGTGNFYKPRFPIERPFNEIQRSLGGGIETKEQKTRLLKYFGRNLLKIPTKPFTVLLLHELLHPLYLFQCFSWSIWFAQEYVTYAVVLLVLSTLSAFWGAAYAYKNMQNLTMSARNECNITAFRYQNGEKRIWSSEIVPGDVVEIRRDMVVPFDCIILKGECVMNESLLTGESAPVLKYSVPMNSTEEYKRNKHKKYTLFCGTRVIQTGKETPVALVTATGFFTLKGEIFHDVLFPKPVHLELIGDSYVYFALMGFIGFAGFVFAVVRLSDLGYPSSEIFLNAIDLITIAVPPLIPLVLATVSNFALARLRKANIICIKPDRLNISGKINLMCFDKTGTLTNPFLAVKGCIPSNSTRLSDSLISLGDAPRTLLEVFMTAHTLVISENTLLGHPVDISMFKETGYNLLAGHKQGSVEYLSLITRPENTSQGRGVIRRFEFEPELQRMAAVSLDLEGGSPALLTVKGSPEVVVTLCNPDTVPQNFHEVLNKYTKQGMYVLACAYAPLPSLNPEVVNDISREEMESNLTFSGFLILENQLKSDAVQSIIELQEALITPLMITGDNILTAVHVARACHIMNSKAPVYICDLDDSGYNVAWKCLDDERKSFSSLGEVLLEEENKEKEFAITGRALELLKTSQKNKVYELIHYVRVYARISPIQKSFIVRRLINEGYFVGMCGDGTNDSGALRAAHIGVLMGDEAPIVAPFVSSDYSVKHVAHIIREGRSVLMTTFSVFQYMVLYPLIQLTCILFLFDIGSIFSNNQFVFTDMVIVFPLAFIMCMTPAAETLHSTAPSSSLFSPQVVSSLVGQIVICLTFIGAIVLSLRNQSWYELPPVTGPRTRLRNEVNNFENTTLFLFTLFSHLTTCMSLATGHPFRLAPYRYYLLMFALFVLVLTVSLLIMTPPLDSTKSAFDIREFPDDQFRYQIWGLSLVNLFISLFYSHVVVYGPIGEMIAARWKKKYHKTDFLTHQ